MPESLKKLRIFAASPSDVTNERAKLATVVDSLKPMADYLGLTLEVVDWRAVVPDAGRPQQVIFDQLKPTTWDIFIGILWHRFGTPPGAMDKTGKEYLSGTEEEFKTAYELWKQYKKPRIVIYRCTRAIPRDADLMQAQRVKVFFKEIENPNSEFRVLTNSFDTTKSFEKLWHDHLQKLLTTYDSDSKSSNSPDFEESNNSSLYVTLPVISSNPSIVNADLSIYTHPPFGQQKFNGIPFYVENARISMADVYDGDGKTFNLQEPIMRASAVHFLINAGDGRKRYGEVTIGVIEFIFKDDVSPQKFEIKLIKNVREWALGNYVTVTIKGKQKHDPLVDAVTDKHISRKAWEGTTSTGQVAVMDMLKVGIDKAKHDKALVAIRFTRDIPPGKYALDYFVSGITVEIRRADSLGLKVEEPVSKRDEKPVEKRKLIIATPQSTLSEHPTLKWITENKITLSNGMELMRVPAGKFIMGNKREDEKPQHTLDIPYDYWMARFPITNELYNDYVVANGIVHPASIRRRIIIWKGESETETINWDNIKNHPLYIDLNNAITYCQWLNDFLKDELPSGSVLRLPTEAEWEKAARGIDGRLYPWGDKFDLHRCNTQETGLRSTSPVDAYSLQGDSPYGIADMSGNVWEWTRSLFKKYPYDPNDGRENLKTPGKRVMRGSSFQDIAKQSHVTSRVIVPADDGTKYGGIRVCLAPPILQ